MTKSALCVLYSYPYFVGDLTSPLKLSTQKSWISSIVFYILYSSSPQPALNHWFLQRLCLFMSRSHNQQNELTKNYSD